MSESTNQASAPGEAPSRAMPLAVRQNAVNTAATVRNMDFLQRKNSVRSWDYSRVQLPFLIVPRSRAADFLETRQVHHEALRSQQGNEALENLVTLCANNPMAVHVVEPDFDPNAPCGLPYHAVPLGRLTGLHNLWS